MARNCDIVTRLREQADDDTSPSGLCIVAADEIERLRLTDAERETIEWCLSLPMLDRDAIKMLPLRRLLERMTPEVK